jgi:hypothetical protein
VPALHPERNIRLGRGRPCVTDPAYARCCLDVPPRRTENAPGGVAAEGLDGLVTHPWLVPSLSLHLQGTPRGAVLLLGFGEVAASVATRMTAGAGHTMLGLDLRAVAALVVVVVDAAVVRAVFLRRRVKRGHLGHVAAPTLLLACSHRVSAKAPPRRQMGVSVRGRWQR